MSVHFSSASNEWGTPQDLFVQISSDLGPFDLDAAATDQNAKCARYYTQAEDGLFQCWRGSVWCNPPYGREIGKWVAKARVSVREGCAEQVVLLIPARTDTAWWHDHIIADADEVRFLRGRVKFVQEGNGALNSAPFPSAVVVFRARRTSADPRRPTPKDAGQEVLGL